MASNPKNPRRRQRSCLRCGACCEAGGAALRQADLPLVQSGKIPLSRLMTIRKGEPVMHPLAKKIQAASVELVKLVGVGSSWACSYYDKKNGCTIYADRPLACRLLRCWDSAELAAIIEKDTLSRLDLLAPEDPLVAEIKTHEELCPASALIELAAVRLPDERLREKMTDLVRSDLLFRQQVVARYRLQLHQELFYFGRPLLQILQQFGVIVQDRGNSLCLDWRGWRRQ